MTWIVTLDPQEVADPTQLPRTTLDLNSPTIMVDQAGIDWGDAAIQSYQAQEQKWGASTVSFRVPNRTVTIPLFVTAGTDPVYGALPFDAVASGLRQKVALLQREGGALKRVGPSGVNLYADIQGATLHFPDQFGDTGGLQPNVTLTLDCLPDFYGDEVTVYAVPAAGSGSYAAVLKPTSGTGGLPVAVIQGDHPARCRIIVNNLSSQDQHGIIWGFRSRNWNPAASAALDIEAEAMTPIAPASVVSQPGASFAQAVSFTPPVAGTWLPFLATDLASSGTPLNHQGTYRVWARCYSPDGTPALRFAWSTDDTTTPTINDQTTIPAAGQYFLLDFGTINVQPAPVGTAWWRGIFQGNVGVQGRSIVVDRVWFQPLDESAGTVAANNTGSAVVTKAGPFTPTGTDDASAGQQAWTNPGNAGASSGASVTLSTGQTASHYLQLTHAGFAIPAGAGITSVQLQAQLAVTNGVILVYLVKAGTVTPVILRYTSSTSSGVFTWAATPADWSGVGVTVGDVNNSGFGAAIQSGGGTLTVSNAVLTVTYGYSGFLVGTDAAVFAGRLAELRTEGMFREDLTTGAYVPIETELGDRPRIPPSGLEGRAVELLVRPTRSALDTSVDSGLDSISVQVVYRPTYLFRP